MPHSAASVGLLQPAFQVKQSGSGTLRAGFSHLRTPQSPGSAVKTDSGPTPKVSESSGLGGAQWFAFLPSSRVPLLLVWGPTVEL